MSKIEKVSLYFIITNFPTKAILLKSTHPCGIFMEDLHSVIFNMSTSGPSL